MYSESNAQKLINDANQSFLMTKKGNRTSFFIWLSHFRYNSQYNSDHSDSRNCDINGQIPPEFNIPALKHNPLPPSSSHNYYAINLEICTWMDIEIQSSCWKYYFAEFSPYSINFFQSNILLQAFNYHFNN